MTVKARRSTPALWGAIVWAVATLALAMLVGCGSLAGPAAAAAPGPAVHVDTQVAEIGQLVHVTGTGWSPVGETVQIELCGQNARDLSADCDQSNQYTAAIRTGGIFYGALTVRTPPSPCPCVLKVTNQSGFSAVDTPITIIGAPSAPVPPPAPPGPPAPVTVSATLLTPTSASAWFGGPKPVTLVLRVTNVSSIRYESPALTVNVGKGSHPNTFAAGRPLAPLDAGATRTLRVPVTLPAVTFGRYSVQAQVITAKGRVTTVVHTSTYPWGLFAAGAVVLLLIVLLIWRRVRRRRRARRQTRAGPGEGPGGGETAPGHREVAGTIGGTLGPPRA